MALLTFHALPAVVAGAAYVGSNAVIVTTPMATAERADMGVFVSHDQARTWSSGTLLFKGPSGYSDAGALDATHAAILFENGAQEFAQKISLEVFAVPQAARPVLIGATTLGR